MEQYIQISKLNDFLYSPASLYLHSIYENFSGKVYKERAQIEGSLNHQNIDAGNYSSKKKIISGMTVYSKEFGLVGKIDIYDAEKQFLIERKTEIKKIHYGYKLQLWAQYYALEEMGFYVQKIFLHSLKDNKRYEIESPNGTNGFPHGYWALKYIVSQIRNLKPEDLLKKHTDHFSDISIYGNLGW